MPTDAWTRRWRASSTPQHADDPIGAVAQRSRIALLAPPGQHVGDRPEGQLEVHPRRPARDVEVVDLDHLRERDSRRAEDLPVAGDPRRQIQASAVVARDLAILAEDERTGPDDAHVSLEDVEELRELVERGAAQELPDPGDAWIVLDLEQPVSLVLFDQTSLQRLGVRDHRPELENAERLAMSADPRLPEEDRTLGI